MGAKFSKPSTKISNINQKTSSLPNTTNNNSRRRIMGTGSFIIEWLKPDCLKPNKIKRKKKKTSVQLQAAVRHKRRNPRPVTMRNSSSAVGRSLEEWLSTSPVVGAATPAEYANRGGGVFKPSPKRIHPSSSSSSSSPSSFSSGGSKNIEAAATARRPRKGNKKSFTLERLVMIDDRRSKEDYFSNSSSNFTSRDVASTSRSSASQNCRKPKKKKRVRFTLPGESDVYVFYSPPLERTFYSL